MKNPSLRRHVCDRGVLPARALVVLALTTGCLASGLRASVIDYQKVVTTANKTVSVDPGYEKIVVCSAGPFIVQAGDLISAHIQEELTVPSSTTAHTMAACGIVVATSPTTRDNGDAGYIGMLSKFSGSNLDQAREASEILTRTGSYQFGAAYSTVYINSIAYAANFDTSAGPDFVIPAGYAEIVAVQERGVTRYATTAYQSLPSDATGYYVPSDTAVLYTQYSYGPLSIAAGTMVDVRFQLEGTTATTDSATTMRLGRRLIQATSSTATTGTKIFPDLQGGATGWEHHCTFSTAAGQYFSTAASGVYFNSALYSYGGTTKKFYIETDSATLYGGFCVELRPYVGFWNDTTRNVTTIDGTQRVLYSVGPLTIPAGQVVEIRYQAAFQPSAAVAFDSMIIRGTSATAVSGTTVQRPLYRKYHPDYVYTNALHSTAEQVATVQTGQYYNVVAWLPNGGSLPVLDWGQLEVVFR